jgi:hypothetical protein
MKMNAKKSKSWSSGKVLKIVQKGKEAGGEIHKAV